MGLHPAPDLERSIELRSPNVMMRAVAVPTLCFASKNDPARTKPRGILHRSVEEHAKYAQFREFNHPHGWTSRGDWSSNAHAWHRSDSRADLDIALDLVTSFFSRDELCW